ncbi:V-type proton ATPase 16 kDa proteolipid subunit [Fukomys damarensis]|uniref:V-type proton ATPase 16 kDa proteolipid subunit n=1 Tax=Fukomys damarensis TaxID=885580 RepID=A0A091E4X0_FUKDA|nr:V-type proton ATPase 16 kDa proteolipid subunit [Fukomys damarensis]
MAQAIALYGMVMAVVSANALHGDANLYKGFLQSGTGLRVGSNGLVASFAISILSSSSVPGMTKQPWLFVGMVTILTLAEVLSL